jgi:hypothetical protein
MRKGGKEAAAQGARMGHTEEQWPHSLVPTTRRRHPVAHLAHPTPWKRIAWHIGGASDPQMPKGGEREGKGSDVPNGGCSAERVPSQRKREEVRGGRRGGRPTKVRKESWCLALAAPIPPTLPWESGGGSVAEGYLCTVVCLAKSQEGVKGQRGRGLGIPAAR